jgi:hypothetical protein
MTEAEFRDLPGADRAPVYDDYEPVVDDLEDLLRSGFDTHRGTDDLPRAGLLARDPKFELACGIRREGEEGEGSILAVFRRKRAAGADARPAR